MSYGTRILNGRYRLDRVAGRGGFASVYLSTDLVLRRYVAVKVLNPELVALDQHGAEHFLDRFAREAQAVAVLDHPNVLAVYDYGQVPGDDHTSPTAYLVMPYIDGGSLYHRLRQAPDGRLPAPLVGRYLGQVAAALDYAHAQGIVHRDIKPQNILLRGDGDRLVLTDFGIAKLLDSASSEQSYTGVVGTLGYMAPEQLSGRTSPVSDVYALGCVVFQLLTGQIPYGGPAPQIVHGHLNLPVPQLAGRGMDECSPATQRVIEQALAKRPEERFARAGDLAAAFAATIAPYPTSAPPVSSGVWAATPTPATGQMPSASQAMPLAATPAPGPSTAAPRAFVRRERGLLGALAALLAVLAVLVGAIGWLGIRARADGGVPTTPDLALVATLGGHPERVRKAEWSPDGTRLATAASDQVVRVWTVEGQLLQALVGHTGPVLSVAWSPDGKRLASSSDDQTVRVWTIDESAAQVLTGHTDRVRAVAWSPDGKLIASASNDRTVRLWPVDGRPPRTLTGHGDFVAGLAWSPNSKLLASSSYDKTIRVWTAEGNLLQPFSGHENYVLGLSWSPDNKAIVSGSGDTTVRVWYLDGRAALSLAGHQAPVIDVDWSPGGDRLASSSADGTIRIWSADGRLLQTLTDHTDWVNSVAWSPGGQHLASGSNDTTVRLWR